MTLPHGQVETPMFMPVGTKGTVKALTTDQLKAAGAQVVLGNTYHLEVRPGSSFVERHGYLHGLSGWKGGMLTDSGGFQMVSLLDLANITEEGVQFKNPSDGSLMMLRPEDSIAIQNRLGADIIMQLDDVVSSVTPDAERFAEATDRTTRWLDRCIKAHSRPNEQNLFAIVQGGLDPKLREKSLADLIARNTPGYAVGGLAGGEDKSSFWRAVAQCTARLPANKPRYVMGIGHPLDIVICSALGADMYDSVYVTRTARFGTALRWDGKIQMRQSRYATDMRPIDEFCPCEACQNFTRSYFHYALANETTSRVLKSAQSLISLHNVTFSQRLTEAIRQAIKEGKREREGVVVVVARSGA